MTAVALNGAAPAPPPPDVRVLQLDDIHVQEGWNARQDFEPAAIDRLAASIDRLGQQQAIMVCPVPEEMRPRLPNGERYLLLFGERRVRALRQLKRTTVNAEVRAYDSVLARDISIAENVDREGLTSYELYLECQRRRNEVGATADTIAYRMGMSVDVIRGYFAIADRVSPRLIEGAFRLDQRAQTARRLTMASKLDAPSDDARHARQEAWWSAEGWRLPAHEKRAQKRAGREAPAKTTAQRLADMADRVEGRGAVWEAETRQWFPLDPVAARAVARFLRWAAHPNGAYPAPDGEIDRSPRAPYKVRA